MSKQKNDIRITLHVNGHAVEFFPGKSATHHLTLPAPMSIREILEFMGVKSELVMFAFSNGQRRDKEYVPADGEELTLITPPAGG